jgi:hypothetical protein
MGLANPEILSDSPSLFSLCQAGRPSRGIDPEKERRSCIKCFIKGKNYPVLTQKAVLSENFIQLLTIINSKLN